MKNSSAVEVLLDLRQYSERIEGARGFIDLWQLLAPTMEGQALSAGKSYNIAHPQHGKIGITLITVPPECAVFRSETPFAIHSVLEQPVVHYACATCRKEGRRQYGPFVCQRCRDDRNETRLCDQHVVVLDGSMASFCTEHHPVSPTGEQAIFWCMGPQCRNKQVAWGPSDRHVHPNDSDYFYCPGCYEELFPQCTGFANCKDTGSNACEFVDPTSEKRCGTRLCNIHVRRWQIYGPHRLGLSLCNTHRRVSGFSDAPVAYEVVAGSAMRGGASRLPTLGAVRHILQNARGRFYELPAIFEMFRSLHAALTKNTRLQDEMGRALRDRESFWRKELEQVATKKTDGMIHFERLKAELHSRNSMHLERVAAAMSYSEYKERGDDKKLFINLDESLRGFLIGRQGATIKSIEARLGVRVQFERLSRT